MDNHDFLDSNSTSGSDDDFFTKGPASQFGTDGELNWDAMFSDETQEIPASDADDGSVDLSDDFFSDDFDDDSGMDFAGSGDEPPKNPPDDAMTDDFSDDFSDDFADDIQDDYADVPSDGFSRIDAGDSDYDADEGGYYGDLDESGDSYDDGDPYDNEEREDNTAVDRALIVKMSVVILSILFAIGVIFYVKMQHMGGDDTYEDIPAAVSENDPEVPSDPGQTEVSSEEPPVSSEEEVVYRELKYKERSDDVKKMQERLCELGYIGQNSCTGFYGDFTVKNLKRFQKAAGLEATGKADQETLRKLFADDAPHA